MENCQKDEEKEIGAAPAKTETEKEKEGEKIADPASEKIREESQEKSKPKSVKTKAPEIEIHLYSRSKGPIDVFKSTLGGWDQDQLEVQDILDKYGFKSIYAFNPDKGRGVAIRFHPRNGRSLLSYRDGSVIYVDGEPKDSMIKPITKILASIALLALLLAVFLRETPLWMKTSNFLGVNFPPWILACIVILFTRLRKRTKDVFTKFGW